MYEITKYPDGSSYVNNVEFNTTLFHRINSYEDLWHLNQIVDAHVNLYPHHEDRPIIFIPNLIDAQADRRFKEGQSSGLKLVCKFLNSMPVKKFQIFHPHNPEVVEALIDNVEIIDNTNFIRSVLETIGVYNKVVSTPNGNVRSDFETYLMSADAGGYKPLMKLADKIQWQGLTYSASKSRKWENNESKITQIVDKEDFGGRNVIIVDDLCVYGGTFKGLASLLRARNVGKLYLAVSHMTIQNFKGGDTVFDYFDGVFTTNSKFDSYWIENRKGEPVQPNNLTIYPIV